MELDTQPAFHARALSVTRRLPGFRRRQWWERSPSDSVPVSVYRIVAPAVSLTTTIACRGRYVPAGGVKTGAATWIVKVAALDALAV